MNLENHEKSSDRNIIKGLAAGLIAGVVASAIMNQFQKVLGKKLTGEARSHGAQSLQTGAPHRGVGRKLEEKGMEDASDDAAERLSQAVSVGVFDHELTDSEKDKAGTMFHYAYGISMAAVYGAAAEILPQTTIGGGMPYGAAIWIGADEVVVPMLGLSKSSGEYPFSIHATALASHLVYGLTTEVVRRAVRSVI